MAETKVQEIGSLASAWSPLAVPAFRTIWIATLIANVGAWMASIGTAWLMTTLDPSPVMVSLVGAAANLPMFLFALPAGALADIIDRRKLLILTQVFMMAAAVILTAMTAAQLITPLTLLILIFLLESGSAVETPAFLAVLPDLVGKSQLQAGLTLNGVGINLSRIIGPAIGGLLTGAAGVVSVFAFNALTFVVVLIAYWRLCPPSVGSRLPAEHLLAAIRSGWRFTRESPELKATLAHAGTFFLFASSYWALLPLVARDQLGSGADVFGVLFGALGAGAVIGAFLLPYVRSRLSPNRLLLAGELLTAAMTAALAVTQRLVIAVPLMLVTGAATLAIMSSLMVSAQVALPAWVKARGLAITQLVFSGALSLGSVLWGVVAKYTGLPSTFMIAAAGLAVASVATVRWRLVSADPAQLTPSLHWPAPHVAETPADDQGPVMVTVEYRVDPLNRAAFAEALERLGHIRRRDGALFWDHFIDTGDPTRHVEVFLSDSWLEHLRQHERVMVADRAVEDAVRAFHVGTAPPVVTHLVSARAQSKKAQT